MAANSCRDHNHDSQTPEGAWNARLEKVRKIEKKGDWAQVCTATEVHWHIAILCAKICTTKICTTAML